MKHLNATPGPWTYYEAGNRIDGNNLYVRCDRQDVCTVSKQRTLADTKNPGMEEHDNAALIAEAGTVYHETGLTPRQLADQRADLLEAMQSLLLAVDTDKVPGIGLATDKARAALARATTTKG